MTSHLLMDQPLQLILLKYSLKISFQALSVVLTTSESL
jgi:hypothetical protein